MGDFERSLVNKSLILYSIRLFNFKNDPEKYQKSLTKILEAGLSKEQLRLNWFESMEWTASSNGSLPSGVETVHKVTIKCHKAIYHVVILLRAKARSMVVINGPPVVSSLCLAWLSKQFDAVLFPLKIETSQLTSLFANYLSTIMAESPRAVPDCMLVFSPKDNNHGLSKITLTLQGDDFEKFKQVNDDIIKAIFDHLRNKTGINFEKLQLVQIKSVSLLLTNAGRARIPSFLPAQFMHSLFELGQ
uniref:ARAD1D09966p n=1 Tax=Blastobotrys adeninivorans TaxID=409370 RepID=A0A060TDT5_BLAAD